MTRLRSSASALLLGMASACVPMRPRPPASTAAPPSPAADTAEATQPPIRGTLRLFHRADPFPGDGPPPEAFHGAALFLRVTRVGESEAVVEGTFLVAGIELRLDPGRYDIETWFRPYTGNNAELAPAIGHCRTELEIHPARVEEVTRVQHGWDACSFREGVTDWYVVVRPPDGYSRGGRWSLRLYYGTKSHHIFAYDYPWRVSAVYLSPFRRRSPHRDIRLVLGASREAETSPSIVACGWMLPCYPPFEAARTCSVLITGQEQDAGGRLRVSAPSDRHGDDCVRETL